MVSLLMARVLPLFLLFAPLLHALEADPSSGGAAASSGNGEAAAVPDGNGADRGFVRFAAIGDGGVDSEGQRRVSARVKSWAPEFIITLGDNNYPDGKASTLDRNVGKYWSEFIHPYRGRFGKGSPMNRFFPSLGNHDWRARGAAPYLDYFSLPGNERYYEFVRGPVHLFSLDSDPNEPDGNGKDSRQARWLKAALAASPAPWKIVYFHHPPYSSGDHGSTKAMRWPFKEWGADVVMSGHDHHYERLLVDGLTFFVNGLGGNETYPVDDPLPGSQCVFNEDNGAMLVEADGDRIDFRFVTADGMVVDTHTLRKPALAGSPASAPARPAAERHR